MDFSNISLTGIILSVIAYAGYKAGSRWVRRLPNGPKGLPFLGVALKHPKTEFWRTYAAWGREYGSSGLISFHVLGRRMVVINSAETAFDLLDKRSLNYSDRPFPAMAGTLMKREKSMFYISYNERFKTYRRLLHQSFNATVSLNYSEVLEREAGRMVQSILLSPENLIQHLRRNAAATTMKIGYGYSVADQNDHFVTLAEESMRVGSLAGAPGKWLVDSIPWLRFLPEWFPGTNFKRQARAWSNQLYTQSLEPHDWVREQIAKGTALPSFTSKHLIADAGGLCDPQFEDIVLWTAGALYAAGADTTVSAIKTFFFVMMLYPEIQKLAQDEVDRFVSTEQRLPKVADRPHLPYLNAILKEVLRWHPPTPIGLFHASTEDDMYQGLFIPAKATIIANIWAMMHDEATYPDPYVFDPNRFLEGTDGQSTQADPFELAFGFGRRVCPGQYLAENSLFVQMAMSLALLEIRKPLDEQGLPIEPEIGFTTAIVSHVKPFKYSICARKDVDTAFLLDPVL